MYEGYLVLGPCLVVLLALGSSVA